MQAVVLAIVSGLVGVVTGAVPALFVSGRRRRADAVREATALLGELQDGPAKASIEAALRRSADNYRRWVEESPADRTRRHREASIVLLAVVTLGIACGLAYSLVAGGWPIDRNTQAAYVVLFTVAGLPAVYLTLKWVVLLVTERPSRTTGG